MKLFEINSNFTTGSRNQKIDQLSSAVAKDYSEAIEAFTSGKKLYKGIGPVGNQPEIFVSHQYLEERRSVSTGQEYTILFSNVLSSWEKFPKRNRSVICSTSENEAYSWAKNAAHVYSVFPANGAKLGACPSGDIWSTCRYSIRLLINEFFDAEFYPDIFNDDVTGLSELSTRLRRIAAREDITVEELLKKDSKFMKTILNRSRSVYDALNHWLDPEANDFNLLNVSNLSSLKKSSSEIWFSDKCLMIRASEAPRIIDDLLNPVRDAV